MRTIQRSPRATAGQPPPAAGSEHGTRGRIARLILENGPVSAAALSVRLGLTPAAVRRHLDNLLAEGLIETRAARPYGRRARGRHRAAARGQQARDTHSQKPGGARE